MEKNTGIQQTQIADYNAMEGHQYFRELPEGTERLREPAPEERQRWIYHFGSTDHYRETLVRKYKGMANGLSFDSNLVLTQERVDKIAELGVTAVVATFDWGEPLTWAHMDEIHNELEMYHSAGLTVAAYHQGCVVPKGVGYDHMMAKTPTIGGRFPYFGTRYMACPNNPEFIELRKRSIQLAVDLGYDKHYVDNGIYPLMHAPRDAEQTPYMPQVCHCEHCKSKFKQQTGQRLQKSYLRMTQEDFDLRQQFRTDTMYEYISTLVQTSDEQAALRGRDILQFHANIFDINGDPEFTERLTGMPVHRLIAEGKLSGVFIEHLNAGNNLTYIDEFGDPIRALGGSVTNLAYYRHIGYQEQLTQEQFDELCAYDERMKTQLCLKGIEYTHMNGDGVMHWENLDVDSLVVPDNLDHIPDHTQKPPMAEFKPVNRRFQSALARACIYYLTPTVMDAYFRNSLMSPQAKEWVFEKFAVI